MLKVSYDKEGDVLEIRFAEGDISESEYVDELGLVVDYDKEGNMLAIEIISFSKRVKRDQIIDALAV